MIHAKRLPENCNLAQSARQLVRSSFPFMAINLVLRKRYNVRESFAESNETRFSVAKIVISHLIILICNLSYTDSSYYDYRYIRSLLLISSQLCVRVCVCVCVCVCKSNYKSCRAVVFSRFREALRTVKDCVYKCKESIKISQRSSIHVLDYV